ncbi:MAG: hypothetical protein IM326_08980 [Microcystis sp. M020S1]|nr:hypothetical protein [Microcystis sp. M020S1]
MKSRLMSLNYLITSGILGRRGSGGWGVGCGGMGKWGSGDGFYRFSGGQLPNFQGKSTGIFPLITPMPGTF